MGLDYAWRKAGTQGKNAGHWMGLTAGAAQRKCERCGMKMSGGPLFIKPFGS